MEVIKIFFLNIKLFFLTKFLRCQGYRTDRPEHGRKAIVQSFYRANGVNNDNI